MPAPSMLCLDLGTAHVGWAHIPSASVPLWPAGYVTSGTQTFKGDRPERLHAIMGWLTATLNTLVVDLIVKEAIVTKEGNRSNESISAAGAVHGVLDIAAYTHDLHPIIPVSPKSYKKLITGNGNAGKPDIFAAMEAMGFDVHTQDQADALAVAHYTIQQKLWEVK